jgi:hypothetical protein
VFSGYYLNFCEVRRSWCQDDDIGAGWIFSGCRVRGSPYRDALLNVRARFERELIGIPATITKASNEASDARGLPHISNLPPGPKACAL